MPVAPMKPSAWLKHWRLAVLAPWLLVAGLVCGLLMIIEWVYPAPGLRPEEWGDDDA